MKTTTTKIETPTLQQEVQRAWAAAPSRPDLEDARRRMSDLDAQRAKFAAEVDRLWSDLKAGKDPAVRVADMIAGNVASSAAAMVAGSELVRMLRSNQDHLAVVEQAQRLYRTTLQALEFSVAREVLNNLRPVLQRMVARAAAALRELWAAADEWPALLNEVRAGGVPMAGFTMDPPISPLSASGRTDAAWLAAVRAQGYEV
jgi:hypothetical protein